jgi:hypothetical protein
VHHFPARQPTSERIFNILHAYQNIAALKTASELERMFRNAGFGRSVLHPIPEMPQSVLVSEKAP